MLSRNRIHATKIDGGIISCFSNQHSMCIKLIQRLFLSFRIKWLGRTTDTPLGQPLSNFRFSAPVRRHFKIFLDGTDQTGESSHIQKYGFDRQFFKLEWWCHGRNEDCDGTSWQTHRINFNKILRFFRRSLHRIFTSAAPQRNICSTVVFHVMLSSAFSLVDKQDGRTVLSSVVNSCRIWVVEEGIFLNPPMKVNFVTKTKKWGWCQQFNGYDQVSRCLIWPFLVALHQVHRIKTQQRDSWPYDPIEMLWRC